MKFPLQFLGAALISAGFLSAAQAAIVIAPLSAVIDFDNLPASLTAAASTTANNVLTLSPGESVTTQYAQYGVVFTEPNSVNCSVNAAPPANLGCTAPPAIGVQPHAGRNFLMNRQGSAFSVNVLDGFSLSTLKLDIARNSTSFYIKFFDANDVLLSAPIDALTGSDFSWTSDVDLKDVGSAVRRIEFGGGSTTSFAIDYLAFDYVVNSTNVPEPAALSMVALALVGVGLSRRRKA